LPCGWYLPSLFEVVDVSRLEPQARSLAGATDVNGVELSIGDEQAYLLRRDSKLLRGFLR
jgi:hypothetical protein